MPQELNVVEMGFAEVKKLPLVVEIEDGGDARYYKIDDPVGFYSDPNYPNILTTASDYLNRIEGFAQKHGKEITPDEFESGSVFPAFFLVSGNRVCTEYRFQEKTE